MLVGIEGAKIDIASVFARVVAFRYYDLRSITAGANYLCRNKLFSRLSYEKNMLSKRVQMVFLLMSITSIFSNVRFVPSVSAQSRGQATVIVKITGLRSEKGQVKIAVFNSSETWLGDHPVYSSTIDVNSQTVTWKIGDVPYGDYGIAVLHDENKNGKMDKNFLGIPQEPYGFSNNMRVTFGPPKWEKSKFIVKGATTEVSIEVQ